MTPASDRRGRELPASFELATAGRVVFGAGTRDQIAPALTELGAERVLLVTGRSGRSSDELVARLAEHQIRASVFHVAGEPSVDIARSGVREAQTSRADAVVAIGGGSALDAGKAIAALSVVETDVMEHLEVVGAGRPLERPPLPFVAVPTTAGTGSEVTRNAVLSVPSAGVKASLRSRLMLPRLAVVDPDLLRGAPAATIAHSGLDALSQLIEPFLSSRANPISDALAREAIPRSARSLRRAHVAGLDSDDAAPVRGDLALASLCGGLCLANAGLGAVHGFAAPLGGMFDAPHGAVCAALLPHVLAVNLAALRARAPGHPALPRFRELGALLEGTAPGATSDDAAVAFVTDLCRALGIEPLRRYGMAAGDIPELVDRAKRASSMKGNPIALTDAELAEIATRAL
jgi:alcohol dehydrogenase class IV